MNTIKFYEVMDRESTNPAMSNNGGDYDFGRIIAVQDGVPVAVRYWTSAEFEYCPHSGGFYACDESCHESGPMQAGDVAGWENGELLTGERAERAAKRFEQGSAYFYHFAQQEQTV